MTAGKVLFMNIDNCVIRPSRRNQQRNIFGVFVIQDNRAEEIYTGYYNDCIDFRRKFIKGDISWNYEND